MKELRVTSAIKAALAGKAQDEDIVAGLVDREKLVVGKDGTIAGLDGQIKTLQESKPAGYNPAHGGGEGMANPFAKETFNLTKQGELLRSSPEQAKALAAAAGVTL